MCVDTLQGGDTVAISQELLDKMAVLEVEALLEGLEDPELRRNPAFLEKVRKFMAQNKLETTPEAYAPLKKKVTEIPIFETNVEVM